MPDRLNFIFDADSTLIQVEGLEELALIALDGNPEKDKIMGEISDITNAGMEGKISMDESLSRRIRLLHADRGHVALLALRLKGKITPSILEHRDFFERNKNNIFVLSGGFRDFLGPALEYLSIPAGNILANSFEYDSAGRITGYDRANPLAGKKGKVEAVRRLGLLGRVFVVGDGYTDYEIREAGEAEKFFAFTENVRRESVVEKADYVIDDFDEFLKILSKEYCFEAAVN